MAGATIHRILGLFVLLGLGLMFGGAAHAGDRQQDANTFSTAPSWTITAQTGELKKPACLHAFEHSHESCNACGSLLMLRSAGRLRAKAQLTKLKPGNTFQPDLQLYPATEPDRAFLHLTNGSSSLASRAGVNIFSRTGRLRI